MADFLHQQNCKNCQFGLCVVPFSVELCNFYFWSRELSGDPEHFLELVSSGGQLHATGHFFLCFNCSMGRVLAWWQLHGCHLEVLKHFGCITFERWLGILQFFIVPEADVGAKSPLKQIFKKLLCVNVNENL